MDTETHEGHIFTPHRAVKKHDRIAFRRIPNGDTNLLLPTSNDILTLAGPTGRYFEGLDHSEAIAMLRYMGKHNKGNSPLLINVDDHSDISDGRYRPPDVGLSTWILNAHAEKLIRKNVVWIFREESGPIELTVGLAVHQEENFEQKGVPVTAINFRSLSKGNNFAITTLNELINQNRYVVSIDADAGNNVDNLDGELYPDFDVDLAATQWLIALCRNASAVMFFHSPDYCDPLYAQEQALKFRQLHARGYPI